MNQTVKPKCFNLQSWWFSSGFGGYGAKLKTPSEFSPLMLSKTDKNPEPTDKRTDGCSWPLCIYTQILVYKKRQKHERKKIPPKKDFLLPLFYPTFQCRRYSIFKQLLTVFFNLEKVKKQASKFAHNRPNPFFSQSSPDHSPQLTAQNWFFILWNLGTRHLFSYLSMNPISNKQKGIFEQNSIWP